MGTIVATCRRFVGLLAIWAAMLGALAAWPGSPQGRTMADRPAANDAELHAGAAAIFTHTGRWIVVGDEDGTVAFVRELRPL